MCLSFNVTLDVSKLYLMQTLSDLLLLFVLIGDQKWESLYCKNQCARNCFKSYSYHRLNFKLGSLSVKIWPCCLKYVPCVNQFIILLLLWAFISAQALHITYYIFLTFLHNSQRLWLFMCLLTGTRMIPRLQLWYSISAVPYISCRCAFILYHCFDVFGLLEAAECLFALVCFSGGVEVDAHHRWPHRPCPEHHRAHSLVLRQSGCHTNMQTTLWICKVAIMTEIICIWVI